MTFTLIGMNVAVFLLELLMGSGISANSGWIYEHGVLYGPAVADGDWWRLHHGARSCTTGRSTSG